HEQIASDLQVGHAWRLRQNVVRAGPAAAEDFRTQSAFLEAVEGLERRTETLQRLLEPALVALDVLRAAVVADDAAQLPVRALVAQLRRLAGLTPGGPAAARADGHVAPDGGDDARLLRGVVEVARVLRIVDRLDELTILLAQRHRASNLRRRHIRRRHQNRFD